MDKKPMFIDIGELGWALYLSAHLRWLKKHFPALKPAVMTYPERKCLYNNLAGRVYSVSSDFMQRFPTHMASCFGLEGVPSHMLKEYFEREVPDDYILPPDFVFRCVRFFEGKVIYEPYPHSQMAEDGKAILVFPRCRSEVPARNLSREFYEELLKALCTNFPDHTVHTLGVPKGSYVIEDVGKENYVNGVVKDLDLQVVVDRCKAARGAVGGTSSLPKLSLLQGVSTFIIGHEKNRFMRDENWMGTRAGFYQIKKDAYNSLEISECLYLIIQFLKEDVGGG